MIKCVLFDMDGTLSNTLDDLKVALNYTLNKLGLPLRSSAEVLSYVGNGIDALVRRGLPENAKDRFCYQCPELMDDIHNHDFETAVLQYQEQSPLPGKHLIDKTSLAW